MEETVEHELCSNCKKEIPHFNYVMHTAHCQRNIILCPICKEPVPKNKAEDHKKKYHGAAGGRKAAANKENAAKGVKPDNVVSPAKKLAEQQKPLMPAHQTVFQPPPIMNKPVSNKPMKPVLFACKFCELELPKKDLDDHEIYCGSRTEKCEECGELVMFKYQQLHRDSNHGFLKLKDEPGPIASWEQKPKPERPKPSVTSTYSPPVPMSSPTRPPKKTGGPKYDTTTEMVRRVDCKTEYIRNLLHETALQTMPPGRPSSSGAVPRSHRKGPAPPPPLPKSMPPTEIQIPCEFCHDMIDADDLVQHETGCRPDLARYIPKTRLDMPPIAKRDSLELATPNSPDVELPCEFCSSLIPASKLLRHQAMCN